MRLRATEALQVGEFCRPQPPPVTGSAPSTCAAGSFSVDIVPTGETSPVVFGPVNLSVEGGSLNHVYAVGDPAAATMNVAVHVIRCRRAVRRSQR